jgi:ribose 5-phosphate isomerase B
VAAVKETIIVGSDHAGFEMKAVVKKELARLGYGCEDVGTGDTKMTDYPMWAGRVARAVSDGRYRRGIVLCSSGIGASIAANRFRGVRAALCTTVEMARLSREHNNANVLALGGRLIAPSLALKILRTWLGTRFQKGRHLRRIGQIDRMTGAGKKKAGGKKG